MLFIIISYVFLQQIAALKPDNVPWLEQMLRQEHLNRQCNEIAPHLNLSTLDHLLVDHKHKLLYCYVPKVACTNWKRVLMVLTGVKNVSNLVDIPSNLVHMDNSTIKLTDLSPKKALECLETYTTFLMVRHPFERILSAYRNKFERGSPYFLERYGRLIIKKYRDKPSLEALETGRNVSFAEFVKYLLLDGVSDNEHWTPIQQLCQPCTLNYTFVAHYETLEQDSRTILGMIGAPAIVFPNTRVENTASMLRGYFQELSIYDIRELYKRYESDFRLFGYGLEQLLGYDLA